MAVNPATGVIIMYGGFVAAKSTDGGQTWTALSTVVLPSPGGTNTGIGFGGGTFIAQNQGGIYLSIDDGATWTLAASGPTFPTNVVTQQVFSPTLGTGSGMWMIMARAGFSTSIDGGNSWTPYTAVPGMLSGVGSRQNLFWDGAQFVFSGRDITNNNSMIAASADGATWSLAFFASIFGPDEIQSFNYGGGQYIAGMSGSENVRQGKTLAALIAAVDTNLAPLLSNATNPIASVFTPDGWLAIASAGQSGSPNVTMAEQDTPSSPWAANSTPGFTGQLCIWLIYDAFHQVLVGSVPGGTIITAPYTLHPQPVPDLIGLNQHDAQAAILAAGFTVGTITSSYSSVYAAGLVLAQFPTSASPPGSAISFTLSLGPQHFVVPNVVGLPLAIAEIVLAQNDFAVGKFSFSVEHSKIVSGSVSVQNPLPGTIELAGTAVDLTIEVEALPFDPLQTVISQYQNSATLLQLVENMSTYIDPTTNLLAFYNNVWNVDTAQGFGLDIWGRIVGVNRVIPIPGTNGTFGFDNVDRPPDWENFGNPNITTAGGPFFAGQKNTGSYTLNDTAFRTLILAKALANICATTGPALNQLVSNLFPGAGRAYTLDSGKSNASAGGMQMTYVFEFSLTPIQFAILANSGVLPHPAGVLVNLHVAPTDTLFGFAGTGLQGFEQGNFNG